MNCANPGRLNHDDALCQRLLHQQGIEVLPGQRATVSVRARHAHGKVRNHSRRLTHPSNVPQLRSGMNPDTGANTQFIQQRLCSGCDALATDLATRIGILFDEHHLPARACKQDGGCSPRRSRADDQCIRCAGQTPSPVRAVRDRAAKR